jgi:hypothetical protein
MRRAGGFGQFRVLYRVFLLRVIDLELLSADGDTAKLLGQFAAVFAGISFLFAAPLFILSGNMPLPMLWTAEHLLIATTMTIVGLFSVLSWDSLMPDRRDVLVLGPLPIRTTTLFSTKLAATTAALGLVIVSLNIFTGLTWPLYFAAANGVWSTVRSLTAYGSTVVLAGIFTYCLVLILQGATMQLLPRQVYLRLSPALQVAACCLFVGLYFLEPSLESRQALAAPENNALLRWLPAYWFLGLFQQLNGSMSGEFASLAHRAWLGLVIAMCAALGVALAAYFRMLPKLVEQPDLIPSVRRSVWWPAAVNTTQVAIFLFSARTLLRSRQHRLVVSFYVGVGGAAVLAYTRLALGEGPVLHGLGATQMRGTVMSATIMLMCVAVAAVRIVFSLPISLRANWIFRMTEQMETARYVAVVRRTLLMMSVIPVWLGLASVLFFLWPPALAAKHLLALALLGGCLVEGALLGFQKVPFTCSFLPGKANVHIAFWISVLLLVPISNVAAHFERSLLDTSPGSILLILALGGILWAARRRNAVLAAAAGRLRFEELATQDVISLELDHGRSIN